MPTLIKMYLHIMYQKIQSMKKNFRKLCEYLGDTPTDIIFLTETLIHSNEIQNYEIPSYTLISNFNDNCCRTGDIVIYIKSTVKYRRKILNIVCVDLIELNIEYNDHDFTFICVFHNCNCNTMFYNHLITFLATIKNHNLVILGDLNINLLSGKSTSIKLLKNIQLQNLLNSQTSSTCTDDIIFGRRSKNFIFKAQKLDGLTDHYNMLILNIQYIDGKYIESNLERMELLTPNNKRSINWQYFRILSEDGEYYLTQQRLLCICCKKLILNSKNTTNLGNHLKLNHRKIFNNALYQSNSKVCENRFECELCKAKFLSKRKLDNHNKKKNDCCIKPYLCDYCGANFIKKHNLIVHTRSHTGEKPYKCEVCHKEFSHQQTLTIHSSVHTGIKHYVCQTCDLRFTSSGNLNQHRRARPDTCGADLYNVGANENATQMKSKFYTMFGDDASDTNLNCGEEEYEEFEYIEGENSQDAAEYHLHIERLTDDIDFIKSDNSAEIIKNFVKNQPKHNKSTEVALMDQHQQSLNCDQDQNQVYHGCLVQPVKILNSGILPLKCKFCDKIFQTKKQVQLHETQHRDEETYKYDADRTVYVNTSTSRQLIDISYADPSDVEPILANTAYKPNKRYKYVLKQVIKTQLFCADVDFYCSENDVASVSVESLDYEYETDTEAEQHIIYQKSKSS